MDAKQLQKELSNIDIDEDVAEDIIQKISRDNNVSDEDNQKETKIKNWQEQKKIEVDWKKRVILMAKIIRINLD